MNEEIRWTAGYMRVGEQQFVMVRATPVSSQDGIEARIRDLYASESVTGIKPDNLNIIFGEHHKKYGSRKRQNVTVYAPVPMYGNGVPKQFEIDDFASRVADAIKGNH